MLFLRAISIRCHEKVIMISMKLVTIILAFGLLSTMFFSPLNVQSALAATYTDVSVVAAKTMIDTDPALVVLDVRNQSEYDTGHIRNTKLIPVWALPTRLNELNPSDTILVYCKAGSRSAVACQTLVNNGFTDVYNMIGGITAWIAEGYPAYVNYSSIQAAIDSASSGSTLYVSSGLYHEHLTVNKPLTLIGENKSNTIIDGSGNGTIFNVTSSDVYINHFMMQNCGDSSQGFYGVCVEPYCSHVSITDNNMVGSLGVLSNSVRADLGEDILIGRNNVTDCVDWCIYVTNSSSVRVLENNIADNWAEARFENCTELVFSGNNVTNNPVGVALENCSGSTLVGNSFQSNLFSGIHLSRSSNNLIFHNNFVENTQQVHVEESGYINTWDNGYPSGGNYWGSYTGVDVYSGPYQNETGSDGIGDTEYVIDAYNRDRYPLMEPYSPLGDINGDGIVDIYDLILVASAYGSTPADPNWNPDSDINGDFAVDIYDLILVAAQYG